MKWYEKYLGGRHLPNEVRSFLSEYKEEEFIQDFTLLFPNIMYAQKVTIIYAATLMMRVN